MAIDSRTFVKETPAGTVERWINIVTNPREGKVSLEEVTFGPNFWKGNAIKHPQFRHAKWADDEMLGAIMLREQWLQEAEEEGFIERSSR